MTSKNEILELRLSIQRALLGEITEKWAAVTCGLDDFKIRLHVYVWGTVTPDDIERAGVVGAYVIADFSEEYSIEEQCLPFDGANLTVLDFWAFMRAEAEAK